MENKLMIFENDAFGKVRTLNLNGEPWFVAVDVCSVLDLSNPTIAVSRLDEDERAKFNLGRQGDATIGLHRSRRKGGQDHTAQALYGSYML